MMKGFLLCLLLVAARCDHTREQNKFPEPRYPIASAVNTFGAKLLKEFRNDHPNSSVVFSPFSIASAFYLLYQGARGQTKKELASLFGFKEVEVQRGLTEKFKKDSTVSSANRIYFDKSVSIERSYAKSVGRRKIRRVPFLKAPEKSRKRINRWVERKTSGFIKDLLSSNSIDASTVMIIVNALYFQGTWKTQFPIDATSDDIFNGIYGKERVPFMKLSQISLGYKEIKELDGAMVILPYKKDDYSMFVFVPNKKNGWKKAEKKFPKYAGGIFDTGFGNQMMKSFRMPKWKMETELTGLVDILIELGIPKTFSAGNFSKISDKTSIVVSDVVHKAKIVVDEKGTEAAASTAIITARSAPRFPPIDVIIDRPFLFFVVRTTDRSVLFQGTVTSVKRT